MKYSEFGQADFLSVDGDNGYTIAPEREVFLNIVDGDETVDTLPVFYFEDLHNGNVNVWLTPNATDREVVSLGDDLSLSVYRIVREHLWDV